MNYSLFLNDFAYRICRRKKGIWVAVWVITTGLYETDYFEKIVSTKTNFVNILATGFHVYSESLSLELIVATLNWLLSSKMYRLSFDYLVSDLIKRYGSAT